jgi:hypothetical protein
MSIPEKSRRNSLTPTVCPLAQPNKAIGLESQIEPWLANCPTAHRRKEAERKNAREIYGSDNLPPKSKPSYAPGPKSQRCKRGLDVRKSILLTDRKKYFFLTSPFIELLHTPDCGEILTGGPGNFEPNEMLVFGKIEGPGKLYQLEG